MSPSHRDAILLRRRDFVVAGLAAGLAAGLGAAALGCTPSEPEAPPHPCLSVAPPEPEPSGDAGIAPAAEAGGHSTIGTDAGGHSTIATNERDGTPLLADTTHWTFDAHKQRFVPRAPIGFQGDRLEPLPPKRSALDPAVARRMGNLADRFVPTATASANLDRRSYPALDELARLMLAGAWRASVQLEMEPDPSRCMAKLTATKRAEAIRGYLIGQGVDGLRLSAEARPVTNPPPRQDCPVGKEPFFQKVLVAVEP